MVCTIIGGQVTKPIIINHQNIKTFEKLLIEYILGMYNTTDCSYTFL